MKLKLPILNNRSGGNMPVFAPGALHAWDFIENRAWFNSLPKGVLTNTPNWSYTRSQTPTAYAQNAAGVLIPFASGVLRRTDKGVLIEGARTNLCLQSQTFDNASWTKTRCSISADAIAAPDGTLTADKVIEDGTASASHHMFSAVITITADSTFTVSGYFKAGERSWAILAGSDATETNVFGAYFNLASGVTGSNRMVGTGSVTAKGITALGNGWYFCWVTGTVGSGVTSVRLNTKVATADGTFTFNGDGVSGFYLWGAQLEAASFPSSYIPTTSASASRAADALTVTSPGVDYPLTLFAEFERVVDTGTTEALLAIYATNATNMARLMIGSTDLARAISTTGSVDQYDASIAGAVSTGATTRIAARISVNDFRHARGGTLGSQDTSGTVPATPDTIAFGQRNAGADLSFGYLRRAAIWNRALSDAELQARTA